VTTVCAVARNGAVVMGADSMTNVYDRPVDGVVKVRRYMLDGLSECLMGFAGDGALPELVAAKLTIPAPPTDGPLQPWATEISVAITRIALDHQVIDEEGRMPGRVLLGYAGKLWTISHQQATPHLDGIAAIGSGEGPAIGAIDYGLARGDDNLTSLVTRAVLIGIERDRFSGGSVTVESLS